MNLQFTDIKNGETFSLGTVSFDYLNNLDIFDKYQQEHDYKSDVIFATDCINVMLLSGDIMNAVKLHPNLREDIKEKLIKFSHYCYASNGVTAQIL